MKQVAGWFVPDRMTNGCGSYVARSLEMLEHIKRIKGRGVAVQAGGHVGTYPRLLSEHFARVYTFEPEAENFGCLVRNCGAPGVFAARGCLGDVRFPLELKPYAGKNTGKHQVRVAAGPVPVYRVDDLNLQACDLLQLDVEGFEIHALRGAIATIRKFRPLIVAEENRRCESFGFHAGDIETLLKPHGYRVVDRVGEDIVLQC